MKAITTLLKIILWAIIIYCLYWVLYFIMVPAYNSYEHDFNNPNAATEQPAIPSNRQERVANPEPAFIIEGSSRYTSNIVKVVIKADTTLRLRCRALDANGDVKALSNVTRINPPYDEVIIWTDQRITNVSCWQVR